MGFGATGPPSSRLLRDKPAMTRARGLQAFFRKDATGVGKTAGLTAFFAQHLESLLVPRNQGLFLGQGPFLDLAFAGARRFCAWVFLRIDEADRSAKSRISCRSSAVVS